MFPPLLRDDHPLLLTTMELFDFSAPDAKVTAVALAATLKDAMVHYRGVGLAANQIGVDVRAFAMETQNGPLVLFNPLVTWLSSEVVSLEEGCLSFEQLFLKITRPKEIQVAYDDEQGHRKVIDLQGIEARCALHEIDHLDGVTFTQRISRLKLRMAMKKAEKMRKKA